MVQPFQYGSPYLLGIPVNARQLILKIALQQQDSQATYNDALRQYSDDGVLKRAPNVFRVCSRLRTEAGPIFFDIWRPIFQTFGDLGVTLLSAPPTVEWWTKIKIEQGGRPESAQGLQAGREWKLEPGLAMVAHIPNLEHIALGGVELEVSRDMDLSQTGPATPQPQRLPTMVYEPGNPIPMTWQRRADRELGRKLGEIKQQVIDALPVGRHPKLTSFELQGPLTKKASTWVAAKVFAGSFCAAWEWDEVEMRWRMFYGVTEDLEEHGNAPR